MPDIEEIKHYAESMYNFMQRHNEFKTWLYSDECSGRLSDIRDKFEQLKLN